MLLYIHLYTMTVFILLYTGLFCVITPQQWRLHSLENRQHSCYTCTSYPFIRWYQHYMYTVEESNIWLLYSILCTIRLLYLSVICANLRVIALIYIYVMTATNSVVSNHHLYHSIRILYSVCPDLNQQLKVSAQDLFHTHYSRIQYMRKIFS